MKDIKHAQAMFDIAANDLKALKGMDDVDTFTNAIFGFHAQQAVEKTAKAWLSISGIEYPKTHDLGELFALLDENGEQVPDRFQPLKDLTDFAVQLRYDTSEITKESLDRSSVLRDILKFAEHVKGLLNS